MDIFCRDEYLNHLTFTKKIFKEKFQFDWQFQCPWVMKLPWVECDVGMNGNHFGMEYEFYSKIEGKGNLFSLKLNSF